MKQSTKYSPISVHLTKKQNVLLNERQLLDVEIRQVESELEELLVELAWLHVLHFLEGRLANQVQAGGNVLGRTDADNIGLNKTIFFSLVSLIIEIRKEKLSRLLIKLVWTKTKFIFFEAGATFDNSFFDNCFVFLRQCKKRSFLEVIFLPVTGRSKN